MPNRQTPEQLLAGFLELAAALDQAEADAPPLTPAVLENALEACRRLVAIENLAHGKVERPAERPGRGRQPAGPAATPGSGGSATTKPLTPPQGSPPTLADPNAATRRDPSASPAAAEQPGTPPHALGAGAKPRTNVAYVVPPETTPGEIAAASARAQIAESEAERLRTQVSAERARYEQSIRQNLRLADENAELRHRVNALQQQVNRLYDKREMSRLLQRLEKAPAAETPTENRAPGPDANQQTAPASPDASSAAAPLEARETLPPVEES